MLTLEEASIPLSKFKVLLPHIEGLTYVVNRIVSWPLHIPVLGLDFSVLASALLGLLHVVKHLELASCSFIALLFLYRWSI